MYVYICIYIYIYIYIHIYIYIYIYIYISDVFLSYFSVIFYHYIIYLIITFAKLMSVYTSSCLYIKVPNLCHSAVVMNTYAN